MPLMSKKPASLAFLLVTVFIDVLGIGLMLPVLPALVGDLAGAPDQQSYWYGALMVTYGVMQFLCMPLLGALSDRFGRRPVLLLSIFGLGVSYLISATTGSLAILLFSRVISGATGASFTVANAYVADITSEADRGKGFGAIGAAFGIGFIIGPVLGGLLAAEDLRLPFKVAAAMALTNWLYGLFVLPESLPADKRRALDWREANPFGAFRHLYRLRGVRLLVMVFGLTLLAQWILQTTWVLYTSFRFGWTPRDNGIALLLVGVSSVIMQGFLIRKLLSRWGELRVAMAGLLSSALIGTGYGLATADWLMYILIPCNLLSFGVSPALQALISRATDAGQQGLTQGSLNALTSLMTILAPLIGTPLLGQVAHLPPHDWRIGITFFVSTALQLSALTLTIWHARRHVQAMQPA